MYIVSEIQDEWSERKKKEKCERLGAVRKIEMQRVFLFINFYFYFILFKLNCTTLFLEIYKTLIKHIFSSFFSFRNKFIYPNKIGC